MIPRLEPSAVPWLSTEQMIEVDRLMVEDYGIGLLQMMENAGRNLARLARERFGSGPGPVVVLAGTGGNGGGALVAARRLAGYGAEVVVATTRPDAAFAPVPARQLAAVRRIGLPVLDPDRLEVAPALVIDGVIGYSLSGDPRGEAARLIEWADRAGAPVLALDVPSGLDAATGSVGEPAVRAAATMTLALPKEGLRAAGAAPVVGELYLADIGVPPGLYAGLGLEVGPVFAAGDLLRLW